MELRLRALTCTSGSGGGNADCYASLPKFQQGKLGPRLLGHMERKQVTTVCDGWGRRVRQERLGHHGGFPAPATAQFYSSVVTRASGTP